MLLSLLISASILQQPIITPDSLRSEVVQQHIAEQVLLFPQEKVYVHTDRANYVAGERIWFSAYLLDAVLHTPTFQSNYLTVEVIAPDTEVVGRVRLKRDETTFSGSLLLSDQVLSGDYILRAYTDHLQNLGEEYFFHRKFHIISPYPAASSTDQEAEMTGRQPDVSFFPEGGQMITGIRSRVAFKALYPNGEEADVNGRLMDDLGVDYGSVETLHAGMGLIELTPAPDRQYFVQLDQAGTFQLPPAQNDQFALKAELIGAELEISILHSSRIRPDNRLFLVLHTRGMVHYADAWDPNYSGISFDTSDFPSGVLQILLLDQNGHPLSERLVFCNNQDGALLQATTDRELYGERQPINATFQLTNPSGQPLNGTFSIAVTDDRDVSPDEKHTILASILLSSELKGYIHDPAYYLQEGNRTAADLLMLTHGWRRYHIPEVLKQQYVQPQIIERQGLEIKGRVTTTGSNPKAVANAKITLFSWESDFVDERIADEQGVFAFNGLEFPDSLTFVLQAAPPRGRRFLAVHVEDEIFPSVPSDLIPGLWSGYRPINRQSDPQGIASLQQDNLLEKANRWLVQNNLRTIDIEEVAINAKNTEASTPSFSYFMPRDRRNVLTTEQLDEIKPMNVSDALMHLPFLRIEADENNQRKVYIGQMQLNSMSAAMGQGLPAVVIVDDVILNEDYDIDNILDPANIETIGVLKGASAVMLGGRGAGGAIVITTRKGLAPKRAEDQNQERIELVNPLGLHQAVTFYSPRYDLGADHHAAKTEPDLRTTIYWHPVLKTTPSGEAQVEFFTGDGTSSYSVVIEGVAENGMLIRKVMKIDRNPRNHD